MSELDDKLDRLGATIDEKMDALCDEIDSLRAQLAEAKDWKPLYEGMKQAFHSAELRARIAGDESLEIAARICRALADERYEHAQAPFLLCESRIRSAKTKKGGANAR